VFLAQIMMSPAHRGS